MLHLWGARLASDETTLGSLSHGGGTEDPVNSDDIHAPGLQVGHRIRRVTSSRSRPAPAPTAAAASCDASLRDLFNLVQYPGHGHEPVEQAISLPLPTSVRYVPQLTRVLLAVLHQTGEGRAPWGVLPLHQDIG